jgi:hypothetical protein
MRAVVFQIRRPHQPINGSRRLAIERTTGLGPGAFHDPPGFGVSQHRKAWRIMKQAHHDHGGRRGRGRRVSR